MVVVLWCNIYVKHRSTGNSSSGAQGCAGCYMGANLLQLGLNIGIIFQYRQMCGFDQALCIAQVGFHMSAIVFTCAHVHCWVMWLFC